MAGDKGKRPSGQDPSKVPGKVGWASEIGDADTWHWDSSLPASEALSELPEPAELAEEPEATDDEGDEDLPTEIPGASDSEVPMAARSAAADSRRRSKTIARKQMLRERRRLVSQGLLPEILDYERPMTRAQCREDKRPCLYVSCRYHLYLDVNPMTGSIKINFPDKEVWQLEQTCALDVAERGGITLEEVGDIMNLTRERIRQVEVSGLDKLRQGDATLETFLDGHELVVGGPTPAGQALLPVLDD
ncbi:MAG: hypothetical protein KC933_26300 [Myxococcales bacterium]|nr:hypothetical protein [Myxococcales bacterium]MCB9651057.1 hypothetical protein [Deltaproteobacteria bacterium]